MIKECVKFTYKSLCMCATNRTRGITVYIFFIKFLIFKHFLKVYYHYYYNFFVDRFER